MGDTILIETTADEVVSIVTQGPQGPSGAEAATLTTQGDTLYRGLTTNQRLHIGSPGQVLKVNSGATAPEWANESGAVTQVNGQTGAVTLTASDVGAAPSTGIDPTAITGTAVVDSDSRLSDSRSPLAHKNSHSVGQADFLAPSDIGAQSIFATESLVLSTSAEVTLTAARAKILDVLNFSGSDVDVVLPQTGNQVGDIFVFRWASGSNQILVRGVSAGSPVISLTNGEQKRVIRGTSNWSIIPVDTHTHADLHTRSHAITSTSDHSAGNHKVFYSDGSGNIQELALGANDTFLKSNGATSAPSFAAASGGIGGGTGSTDNAILRADGTGGATAQAADIVIDDATTSTQANVALLNNHSETNSALVLTPKGTGAFIVGPKPDDTIVGGNSRGLYATDLQIERTNVIHVASGNNSALIGGARNRASGSDSAVLGGRTNAATNTGSVAIGGQINTASGAYALASGNGSTASADSSFAFGQRAGADRQIMAWASGGFTATAGVSQRIFATLRNTTTTNSAVELFLNGSSTRLTCPSGKVMAMLVNITGVKSDGSAVAHYVRQYAIKNVGGTTSEVYAPVTIGTDNAASTSITLSANDTNDALKIEVTGIASETWRWVASVDAVEVAYGS